MKKEAIRIGISGFLLIVLSAFLSPSVTGYAVKDKGMLVATNVFLFFKLQVVPRLIELLTSPFTHAKTMWMIVPLIITIFFLQAYFGRWKNEKLGWNSAFGNMIALLFITVSLMYEITHLFKPIDFVVWGTPLYKAILVTAIALQVLLMMIFIFMHAIPKRLSYFIGSPLTTYTIAFVAIVLVYADIPIDWLTLIAFIILYMGVQIFFAMFRWLIPPSKEAEQYLKEREKKHEKIKKEEEKIKQEHREEVKKSIKDFFERVKNRFFFWRK